MITAITVTIKPQHAKLQELTNRSIVGLYIVAKNVRERPDDHMTREVGILEFNNCTLANSVLSYVHILPASNE